MALRLLKPKMELIISNEVCDYVRAVMEAETADHASKSGLLPPPPPRRSNAYRPPPRPTEAGETADHEAEVDTVVASAVEAEGDKAEDVVATADQAVVPTVRRFNL